MLSEYITSLADVSFHIVAYMYARFRYSGKKSNAVCGFLAYFCAVLRFSDPPYAPLPERPEKACLGQPRPIIVVWGLGTQVPSPHSLVPRPVRAIRVTRGRLEPSALARGLAKNGKKVPDRREKVPDNFSTKILCFLRRSRNISDS